jgi:hypothetical protein
MSSLREGALAAASDAERRSRQSPPLAEPSLEGSPAFIRVDEFLDEWFAAIGVARPSSARVKARMGEDESGPLMSKLMPAGASTAMTSKAEEASTEK